MDSLGQSLDVSLCRFYGGLVSTETDVIEPLALEAGAIEAFRRGQQEARDADNSQLADHAGMKQAWLYYIDRADDCRHEMRGVDTGLLKRMKETSAQNTLTPDEAEMIVEFVERTLSMRGAVSVATSEFGRALLRLSAFSGRERMLTSPQEFVEGVQHWERHQRMVTEDRVAHAEQVEGLEAKARAASGVDNDATATAFAAVIDQWTRLKAGASAEDLLVLRPPDSWEVNTNPLCDLADALVRAIVVAPEPTAGDDA